MKQIQIKKLSILLLCILCSCTAQSYEADKTSEATTSEPVVTTVVTTTTSIFKKEYQFLEKVNDYGQLGYKSEELDDVQNNSEFEQAMYELGEYGATRVGRGVFREIDIYNLEYSLYYFYENDEFKYCIIEFTDGNVFGNVRVQYHKKNGAYGCLSVSNSRNTVVMHEDYTEGVPYDVELSGGYGTFVRNGNVITRIK